MADKPDKVCACVYVCAACSLTGYFPGDVALTVLCSTEHSVGRVPCRFVLTFCMDKTFRVHRPSHFLNTFHTCRMFINSVVFRFGEVI